MLQQTQERTAPTHAQIAEDSPHVRFKWKTRSGAIGTGPSDLTMTDLSAKGHIASPGKLWSACQAVAILCGAWSAACRTEPLSETCTDLARASKGSGLVASSAAVRFVATKLGHSPWSTAGGLKVLLSRWRTVFDVDRLSGDAKAPDSERFRLSPRWASDERPY